MQDQETELYCTEVKIAFVSHRMDLRPNRGMYLVPIGANRGGQVPNRNAEEESESFGAR